MVALLRFSTVVLVLFIMPEISPYRINIFDFLPYFADDTENNGQRYPALGDIVDRVRTNFGGINNPMQKRNGDLINFLLGLPKGMLDAGKK